ncbi:YopX superfamily protein [Enterococcus mundtii QU 25]|uniref:YopX family protein n=1 Tax=Enterococcus mundtii TaxID=53346 RepID=UPI0003C539D7|nr:YopX family protein [Enterococcus mundtii]BAO06334.1 YopX superfamily protein [Enterococcus mundtii QU 25]
MIPKFRALNIKTGFWFDEQELVFCDGKWFHNWRSFEDEFPLNMRDCVVMQSTGLKDKNGVEIFERDIIKNSNGLTGYVTYLQQEAGFVVVLKKSDYRLGHRNTGESYAEATNHEVIGNIYENPELLEEVKK